MKDVDILVKNGVNVKKSLELFGDIQTYDSTLTVFLNEVEGKLKKIENYHEVGDMANYAIEVHSLKSDSKYFGFEKLAELAYDHEMASKKNDLKYCNSHYKELIEEANRIVNLVKKYMGEEYDEEVLESDDCESFEKAILVVDDSNIICNFITKIFKDDYLVLEASDGKKAIDILESKKRKQIEAVLLDLNMPDVNGFTVLDYFKDHDLFTDIPVAIITGADDKESINKAYNYKIVDILLKPFNEKDLKKILEKTLNSKK